MEAASTPLETESKQVGLCCACSSPLASFTCACTAPSSYFCEVCLPNHLRSPGLIHIPMSTFLVNDHEAATPRVCSECSARESLHVCICTVAQGVAYCEPCYNFHCVREHESLHYKLPVSTAEEVLSSHLSTDQFLKRQLYLDRLSLTLRQNLSTIESLVTETQQEFELTLKELLSQKEKCMRELAALRVDVERLTEDFERTIETLRFRSDYQPQSFLEELVLNGWKQTYDYSAHVVQFFTAVVDIKSVQMALERCVRITRNFDGFGSNTAPMMSFLHCEKAMAIHLPDCRVSEAVVTKTSADSATSHCLLDAENLLSCGGTAHNRVYLTHIPTQTVQTLKPMNQIRGYTGLLRHRDCVYVFGGSTGTSTLSTSEKLDLKSNLWYIVPAIMAEARHSVSLCECNGLIYLVGGHRKRSIESFHIADELFSLLSIELPTDLICVCFPLDQELVIIQGNQLVRWTVDSSATTTLEIAGVGECWSCVLPVAVGREVFFLHTMKQGAEIIKCDLPSLHVSRVRSLEFHP